MESANQLAMKVASDDEDDAVDQLLEQQHQRMMRSTSAYSLASNMDSSGHVRTYIENKPAVHVQRSNRTECEELYFSNPRLRTDNER